MGDGREGVWDVVAIGDMLRCCWGDMVKGVICSLSVLINNVYCVTRICLDYLLSQ